MMALAMIGCGEPQAEPDGGPVGTPLSCGEEPCAYVIAGAYPPRMDTEGRVIGVDLDDHVSDETSEQSCGHADFVSPGGTPGVDNEFARFVPTLEDSLGTTFELNPAITSGELLFGLALVDVDSTEDPSVLVSAGPLRLPAESEAPVITVDGTLQPGQTFGWAEATPTGEGSIEEAVLDVPLGDVDIGWTVDETTSSTLHIRDARLRVPFADGEPGTAVLAGRLWIDDLVVLVPLTGGGHADNRELLEDVADLDPNAEGVCQSISIAIEVELVRARIEP